MKPLRGISKEPSAEVPSRLGRANWLLIGVFLLVLGQTLMSLPIRQKFSALISTLAPARQSASSPRTNCSSTTPMPWGDLECERVVLEVPDDYISDKPLPEDQRDWHCAPDMHQRFLEQWSTFDLPSGQRDLLQNTNRWRSSTNGYYFSPDASLVLGMNAHARRQIYSLLSLSPKNFYQSKPFTFHVDTLTERFAGSGISEETAAIVKSLLYQRGVSLCFSDINAFDDLPVSERRRLLKTLTRVPVVFLRLRVGENSDVSRLVDYWGKQGNAHQVKSMLETLAGAHGGSTVDVAPLLPPFARRLLYTFPYPSSAGGWERQDCFWTSLNFFADHPDDRVPPLDLRSFTSLKEDYYQIESEPAFGDLVALVTSERTIKHVCVYVADDVVFTKNGGHFLQPWALMKLSDMKAKYPADPPLEMAILRPKKT